MYRYLDDAYSAPPRTRTPLRRTAPRPASSPSHRTAPSATAAARRHDRIRQASEYCADIVDSGWKDTVADSAANYVTTATADRVFHGRRRRCKALAQAAAALLDANQDIHKGIGWLTSRVLGRLGAGDAVSAFVGELASNIPLPTDAKIIVVARGVQVSGVAVCVANSVSLEYSQCFIDLTLDLAKTQVKKLLITAEGNWLDLARFQPRPRAGGSG